MEPATNWILQLVDVREELDTTIGMTISVPDIVAFTERAGKPFVSKMLCHKMLQQLSLSLILKRLLALIHLPLKLMVNLRSTHCIHTLVCPELLGH